MRDAKVVDELEQAPDRGEFGAIVVHLLGPDYCKDRGLPTDGAMLVFRRLKRAARILFADAESATGRHPCGRGVCIRKFIYLGAPAGDDTKIRLRKEPPATPFAPGFCVTEA